MGTFPQPFKASLHQYYCRHSAQEMKVVVGTNSLTKGGSSHPVGIIMWHEAYNPQNNMNDVAVLLVVIPITFGPKVKKIALMDRPVLPGSTATLTGWGYTTYPEKDTPDMLQYIDLEVIPHQQCVTELPGFPVFITHVCTTSPKGKGACQGDSGGPLVSNNKQIGIVSWGVPCAKGKPDIFTGVSPHRDWIYQHTGV